MSLMHELEQYGHRGLRSFPLTKMAAGQYQPSQAVDGSSCMQDVALPHRDFEVVHRPRQIVTRKALENAAAVVAATGGSTNGALHLPAIAHECGIKFDLFDVAKVFERTPYIADLKPSGRYVAKDLFEAGGVPLLGAV